MNPTVRGVPFGRRSPRQRGPYSTPIHSRPSRRLHSRYQRVLHDLPWQGHPATIRITARRFRCLNLECARKTFAERLGSVAPASARRTTRLGDLQRHVAFALGGEAAARLTKRLAIPASPDTLLRMAVRSIKAEIPPPTTKILGVDDWAWRRGHRYGTILVDLERNEVVDLLPDRQAETLASVAAPASQASMMVARDRAGAYAEGIRQGAPEAVQVSDRWHLLRNLGDAVRVVSRPPPWRHLRHAAKEMNKTSLMPQPAGRGPSHSRQSAVVPRLIGTAQRRSQDAHARRHVAVTREAAQLRAAGVSISAIAASLGAERKTIRPVVG